MVYLSKMADDLVILTHVQSQVPVVFIVSERFSVDGWKRYKNASVGENILDRAFLYGHSKPGKKGP